VKSAPFTEAGRHSYSEGTGWAQATGTSVKRSVQTAIHDTQFQSFAVLMWGGASDVVQSAAVNAQKDKTACRMSSASELIDTQDFAFPVSQETAVSPHTNPAPFRTSEYSSGAVGQHKHTPA
jgi:hypothetical protein